MDKEAVVYIYHWIILSHKKEWKTAICSNMDVPRDYHTKWSMSDRERQVYDINYTQNLKKKNDTNECTYKTEIIYRLQKPSYDYQRGNMTGRDKLGIWD